MLFDVNTLMAGAIAADGTRSGQAITATAVSTNIIDTRQPNGTPAVVNLGLAASGVGTPWLVVVVGQAFNTLTSLTTTLESAANTSLTSSTVHATTTTLLAGLTAGATVLRIPLPSDSYQRYVGLRFTVTGANPTQGTLFAYISLDPNVNPIYASGFTIDV